MDNLEKIIKKTKKLIDLPYNKFNIDNYLKVLSENYSDIRGIRSFLKEDGSLRLMGGDHPEVSIIEKISKKFNNEEAPRVILVGKGILFDSGGLDIKTNGMDDMTNDKAGMLIALAVAEICPKVAAFCPATTNFVQNSKITPGDIITIGDKKVKITSTDAEGRVILAEALSLIKQRKDDIIITIATLTGCVSRAVDIRATGVLTPSDVLAEKFARASKKAKELSWRLPLYDYMQDFYKKEPIKNYEKGIQAGASEGAMFIKQFVKYPENWIHLDIAYSAFDDKKKKANGVPIKTLVEFVKEIKNV